MGLKDEHFKSVSPGEKDPERTLVFDPYYFSLFYIGIETLLYLSSSSIGIVLCFYSNSWIGDSFLIF